MFITYSQSPILIFYYDFCWKKNFLPVVDDMYDKLKCIKLTKNTLLQC